MQAETMCDIETRRAIEGKMRAYLTVAMDVQTACNLNAVVQAMAKQSEFLVEVDRNWIKRGTSWRNRHPLMVIWTQTCMNLTGLPLAYDDSTFGDAIAWAQRAVVGDVVDILDYTEG